MSRGWPKILTPPFMSRRPAPVPASVRAPTTGQQIATEQWAASRALMDMQADGVRAIVCLNLGDAPFVWDLLGSDGGVAIATGRERSLVEAVRSLQKAVIERYPDSKFARTRR
jgi:hypothetical protein